jgi:hypothetical protein
MRIREAINKRPALAIGISLACVAVVVGIWLWRAFGDQTGDSGSGTRAWYTIDDGRTWFADAATRVVPFEHQGKPAYRCRVWVCEDGKTQFVSHLERLNDSTRRALGDRKYVERFELLPGCEEVKRPRTGDKGWININTPEAQIIQAVRCPDGKGGVPKPVWPD